MQDFDQAVFNTAVILLVLLGGFLTWQVNRLRNENDTKTKELERVNKRVDDEKAKREESEENHAKTRRELEDLEVRFARVEQEKIDAESRKNELQTQVESWLVRFERKEKEWEDRWQERERAMEEELKKFKDATYGEIKRLNDELVTETKLKDKALARAVKAESQLDVIKPKLQKAHTNNTKLSKENDLYLQQIAELTAQVNVYEVQLKSIANSVKGDTQDENPTSSSPLAHSDTLSADHAGTNRPADDRSDSASSDADG